jgi:excinuclease ABC subunit C
MTPETNISPEIQKLLDQAPSSPGVYLMKARSRPDAPRQVVYVGMSNNLRGRVRTYFVGPGDGRAACEFIRRSVDDIEFIVTDSEKEALLLENVLIKKYKPKYNVLLKDDKTYLSIHVNPNEEWPRLRLVRIRKTPPKGSGKYFGPYASADDCRKTVALINRLFPLRKCSDSNFRNRTRPCLYHQIKQCLGPCCGLTDRKTYMNLVEQVIDLLRGNAQAVIKQQEEEMKRLSGAEQFEQAAVARDRIRAIQATLEKQKVVKHEPIDRDIFGYHRLGNDILFEQLTVRSGMLSAGKSFPGEAYDFPSEEVFGSFMALFYEREGAAVPPEILVPHDFEGRESLEAVLGERKGKKVSIIIPQRGEKLQLVNIAARNAEAVFREKHSEEERARSLLDSLQKKLRLRNFPRRIECYDISNIGGTDAVGSMVVFIDGKPDRSEYRRFRIKTVSGSDDYAMMKEVIGRRLRHSRADEAAREEVLAEHWPMPDLILVDGGKGQLNIACAVIEELGIKAVDAASIAKVRDEETGRKSREQDIAYIPGRANPITFHKDAPELFLLQRVRDEAHRFAIEYHKKLREKKAFTTVLDDIPGVGPARRIALLKHFGSVDRIARATPDELTALTGISPELAHAILEHLKKLDEADGK